MLRRWLFSCSAWLAGPSAHLGLTWPMEQCARGTLQPDRWITKQSIWFLFQFSFLEGRGQAGYELHPVHAFVWCEGDDHGKI